MLSDTTRSTLRRQVPASTFWTTVNPRLLASTRAIELRGCESKQGFNSIWIAPLSASALEPTPKPV
jgi:hypothetical protein